MAYMIPCLPSMPEITIMESSKPKRVQQLLGKSTRARYHPYSYSQPPTANNANDNVKAAANLDIYSYYPLYQGYSPMYLNPCLYQSPTQTEFQNYIYPTNYSHGYIGHSYNAVPHQAPAKHATNDTGYPLDITYFSNICNTPVKQARQATSSFTSYLPPLPGMTLLNHSMEISLSQDSYTNEKQQTTENTPHQQQCMYITAENKNLNVIDQKNNLPEKSYQCEHCLKFFRSKTTLRVHTRLHTGQKPYNCKYCNLAFSDISCKTKHQRIHTKEKPYKCGLCVQKFSQSGNLRRHQKNIHKMMM